LLFTTCISLLFTAQSGGTAPTKLNLANQTKLKQQSQVRQSQGSLKYSKSVTFKAGLLADWEHEAYFGPLMCMDEV
jgi:hypothetical protein